MNEAGRALDAYCGGVVQGVMGSREPFRERIAAIEAEAAAAERARLAEAVRGLDRWGDGRLRYHDVLALLEPEA